MTKKGFDYEECYLKFDGEIFAIAENKKNAKTIGETLIQLFDENEQLKIDLGIAEDNHKLDKEIIDDIHNEFQKVKKENEQLKQFKNEVFNLINAKIKLYSHKPVSAPISQPMSVNFDADMDRLARLSELKALKEELQE